MNFYKLYKLVLLTEETFADLPDVAPYGFWLFPNGNFKIVSTYGHWNMAREIIRDNIEFEKEYVMGSDRDVYTFLHHKGYVDVVKENGEYLYRNDLRSSSQKRTLKDIATFYHKTPRRTT